MNTLKLLGLSVALVLAACTSTSPAPPPKPSPTAPAPTPKPSGVVPNYISQNEAEQLCTLKAAKKFGGGIGDVKVGDTTKVDAGYRVRLSVGGQDRTCIISPQGDLRSLI